MFLTSIDYNIEQKLDFRGKFHVCSMIREYEACLKLTSTKWNKTTKSPRKGLSPAMEFSSYQGCPLAQVRPIDAPALP